ncbi:MAG: fibronectin type III domain-containing protein, partial [Gaiellaceae bacterium]
SQITTMINNTKDDPKVYGYFFSDEPNPFQCLNAVQAHRARVALIRSLTNKPTVMVLDSNRGQETLDQIPLWVGVADFVNLDIYPCYQGQACRFDYERQVIAAADAAGLVYWGGVQAFNDTEFRWPTVAELQTQLSIWSASHWHGMMLFSLSWGGGNLYDHPDLVSVLQAFNSGSAPPPTTTTTPTPTAPTTTTTPPTTTAAADTKPPTTPTNLRVTLGTPTSLTLSWVPSSDNVGVAGYHVWRNGNLLSLQPGTSRTQVNLKCTTNYRYEVAAFDAAGNVSPRASYTAVCGFH